ncbi:MAG: hypothetical protein ACTTJC_05970 [Campylobacter sp.]
MKFGFLSGIGEITPSIFLGISNSERARIFLNLYNCCVCDGLKIPLEYANLGLNIGEIFAKRIDDLLQIKHCGFSKIANFCIGSNVIIKSYASGGINSVPYFATEPKHNAARLINLLKSQNGVCFDADIMFSQFVYDKIRKKHFDKSVYFQDGIIFAESNGKRLFGVMPCFKEITKKRFHLAGCEIAKGFKALCNGDTDKMFIVAPRSENFSRYIEVRNDFIGGLSLRLVPYTISHHIF